MKEHFCVSNNRHAVTYALLSAKQAKVNFYAPDSRKPDIFSSIRSLPAHWSASHTTYWQHGDHLGSASWVTDTNGTACQHLQYMPWGEPLVDLRSSSSSYDTRYTFSGKERDEETGYSYFGARYYNSALSIWLSVDPMAAKYPSLSPYAYCANNPVKLVDPNGREWDTPEDMQKANEMREKANSMVYYYNTQIDKYKNDPDCSEYISDLQNRIDMLHEGLQELDNMENSRNYRFSFVEVQNGEDCFVRRFRCEGNDNMDREVTIKIHSDDNIETRWHECAHFWDYRSDQQNAEHNFTQSGYLGCSDLERPRVEGYAYKQEFSFSQKRFNGVNLPRFDYLHNVNWSDISPFVSQ